jgi:hypothetical protein
MSHSSTQLRSQALKCRRSASTVCDEPARAALMTLAVDLEERAIQADAKATMRMPQR